MKDKKESMKTRNERRFTVNKKGFDFVCRHQAEMEKSLGIPVTRTMALNSLLAKVMDCKQ